MSPTCAIPDTTTTKISGVMVTLISEMKTSPSGFMSAAKVGARAPSSAPSAAPMATSTYCSRHSGLRRRVVAADGTDVEVGVVAICKMAPPGRSDGGYVLLLWVHIGPASVKGLMPYWHDLRTKSHHGPELAGGLRGRR